MKNLSLIFFFLVLITVTHAQESERSKAIDTTYSELVYVSEKMGDQVISALDGGRHNFRVAERIEPNYNLQTLKLVYDDREYTLTLQNKKAISLHQAGKLVATISDSATVINNTQYTFKKINELEFSYSYKGQEIMHGRILNARINKKNIYGQYLDYKKYQHENQEVLQVLASFYSIRMIDKMIKRNKSFFYALLG